jgi:signal transduction histidine kinase
LGEYGYDGESSVAFFTVAKDAIQAKPDGQIITNAVKYHGESLAINFSEELHKDYTRLVIHDNGIGIPEGDLARVFGKGFTGNNGRKYGKSTGIGLYLCNKLCLRTNMRISVESKENEGTSVILAFPGNSLLTFQNG